VNITFNSVSALAEDVNLLTVVSTELINTPLGQPNVVQCDTYNGLVVGYKPIGLKIVARSGDGAHTLVVWVKLKREHNTISLTLEGEPVMYVQTAEGVSPVRLSIRIDYTTDVFF
jgi:hypothetical protein